jgi:hypothetical protein
MVPDGPRKRGSKWFLSGGFMSIWLTIYDYLWWLVYNSYWLFMTSDLQG